MNVIRGTPTQWMPLFVAEAIPNNEGAVSADGHAVMAAGQLIVGGVVHPMQLTVTVKLEVVAFPQKSVAVYITVVDPSENTCPLE